MFPHYDVHEDFSNSIPILYNTSYDKTKVKLHVREGLTSSSQATV